MFYVKNFKDDNLLSVSKLPQVTKNTGKAKTKIPKQNNPNPSTLDVEMGYFNRGLKIPIQYERHNNTSNIPPDGRRINTARSPIRNLKLGGTNIRTISEDYKRELHSSHSNRAREVSAIKDIKQKSYNSDIFFQKTKESVKELSKNAILKRNCSESNIFFLQNKGQVGDRSGEKYAYHPRKQIYGTTTESNSQWGPNTENRSMINYSGSDYLLFNPETKNISKTKVQIFNEAKFNPIYRQKSISEYTDIFGSSCFNPNKNFVEIANLTKNAFNQNSEVCATYLDIHHKYLDLCNRPFVKKII